jgi:hypothetical protein
MRAVGFIVYSMDQTSVYRALRVETSDDRVSASLFGGFRFLMKPEAQSNRDCICFSRQMRCAEVRTSRIRSDAFQLESLILAQNERWRQA